MSFVNDLEGRVLQRHEADANTSTGDPHELHYYFGGIQLGDVSNNGTSDIDYAASIAQKTALSPVNPGPFQGGAATGTSYADFDQSYDPINGLNYLSTGGRYTVADGDSLQSIALQAWGDAGLWYLIADANGLSGGENLPAGMSLTLRSCRCINGASCLLVPATRHSPGRVARCCSWRSTPDYIECRRLPWMQLSRTVREHIG